MPIFCPFLPQAGNIMKATTDGSSTWHSAWHTRTQYSIHVCLVNEWILTKILWHWCSYLIFIIENPGVWRCLVTCPKSQNWLRMKPIFKETVFSDFLMGACSTSLIACQGYPWAARKRCCCFALIWLEMPRSLGSVVYKYWFLLPTKHMKCTIGFQVSFFLLVSLAARQEARIAMEK